MEEERGRGGRVVFWFVRFFRFTGRPSECEPRDVVVAHPRRRRFTRHAARALRASQRARVVTTDD